MDSRMEQEKKNCTNVSKKTWKTATLGQRMSQTRKHIPKEKMDTFDYMSKLNISL